MGLLQKAVETYDANQARVGVYMEGFDPLAPIGHTLISAKLEITINQDGKFLASRKVDKSEPKILIPVTEESAGRTSKSAYQKPHPLCDQVKYITAAENYYIRALEEWACSQFSHPFLKAILAYVSKGTILTDIESSGEKPKDDDLICWRVLGFADEEPACWRNQNLFQSFIWYYCDRISGREAALCMIEGTTEPVAAQHPKGIIPVNGNAKLISANDSSGFTYRGRFSEEWQAATIGYIASQKAHNALRWLASEQGVREFVGNRIFLCWNPQGRGIPQAMRGLRRSGAEPKREPSVYQSALQSTMLSLRRELQLDGTETAVVAAFDAATIGRLALTYYNELSLPLFLQRMRDWDAHCCWYAGQYGIQAPNLMQLVDCAYGTQRGNFLETDNRIQRQHIQRLLSCKLNGGVFPADMVQALVQRASTPLAYKKKNWREILCAACAALRKYHYDTKQGGNEMAWELDKMDRSFQFGRLLAAMERAEEDYYRRIEEDRQTNAIKFMSEFRQRPWMVFERVNRQLHQAYLTRVLPWQANRYKRLAGEICGILGQFPEADLNKPLEDVYLMGYELQRNAFYTKNDTEETEE